MAAIYKLKLQINEYATKPCDALYLGIQSVHSNYKSELFLVSQSVEIQSLFIFFEKDIEIQVQLFAYHGLLGNSDCSISIAKASLEFKETVFLITDTDQVCGILTMERLVNSANGSATILHFITVYLHTLLMIKSLCVINKNGATVKSAKLFKDCQNQ